MAIQAIQVLPRVFFFVLFLPVPFLVWNGTLICAFWMGGLPFFGRKVFSSVPPSCGDLAECAWLSKKLLGIWVGNRELLPVNPRRRRHGKVHRFKRETVLEFIRKRYEPAQIGEGDDDQD